MSTSSSRSTMSLPSSSRSSATSSRSASAIQRPRSWCARRDSSCPPRTVAQDGVKLRLARRAGDLDAVAWGAAHRLEELQGGGALDVVFRVERDDWLGDGRVQAKVTDFRV